MKFAPSEKGQGLIEILILLALIVWVFMAIIKLGNCMGQPIDMLKIIMIWTPECN